MSMYRVVIAPIDKQEIDVMADSIEQAEEFATNEAKEAFTYPNIVNCYKIKVYQMLDKKSVEQSIEILKDCRGNFFSVADKEEKDAYDVAISCLESVGRMATREELIEIMDNPPNGKGLSAWEVSGSDKLADALLSKVERKTNE